MKCVVVSDVQAIFPSTLTADQERVCKALLDDAWEFLLIRVPDLEARIESGELRPATVVAVVRPAVADMLRNPEGWEQESLADWSGRRSAPAKVSDLFTDEMLAPLMPPIVEASRAFEIIPC